MARFLRGTLTALGRIRFEKQVTLIGRTTTRLLSYSIDDDYNGFVSSTDKFIGYAINCQESTGIVAKSLTLLLTHTKFDDCSIDTKLKVISQVFDRIRNYPQANPYEVFLMKIYLKSMCTDESKRYLTKEEVISRVFNVVQSHPKVPRDFKVTEETHFGNDLGFDDFDYKQLQKALYLEFKLHIDTYRVKRTCKQPIDYIYEYQKERKGFEAFRERHIDGDVFWPAPLI